MGGCPVSVIPPLLTITLGGGGGGRVHGKKKKSESIQSQLSAFSNPHTDFGAPGYKACHKLGSAIFRVTLGFLDICSKKKVRIETLHIILKHTICNKLVSKVFAQKKGEKSYDSYKYVFKFCWFQV